MQKGGNDYVLVDSDPDPYSAAKFHFNTYVKGFKGEYSKLLEVLTTLLALLN